MSSQTEFIIKIVSGAHQGMAKYGVLASVSIAQAILESGWGTGTVAKCANNLFGILANGWTPPKVYEHTYKGKTYIYRKYNSWEDSIADHSQFIASNSRYKAIIGNKDYKSACNALQFAGYAGDPKTEAKTYATELIKLIQSYNLTQYDALPTVKPKPTFPPRKIITIKVKDNWNVRIGAGTNYKVITVVKNGTKLQVYADKVKGWYELTNHQFINGGWRHRLYSCKFYNISSIL